MLNIGSIIYSDTVWFGNFQFNVKTYFGFPEPDIVTNTIINTAQLSRAPAKFIFAPQSSFARAEVTGV